MTESNNGPSSPRGAETTGRIVVALFEARSEAEDAIRDLKSAGFTSEQIGLATQEALTGGVIGEDARYFDAGLRQGRTLVTVSSTNETPDEAMSILERHGGDLGPSRARSGMPTSYPGEERRTHADAAYSGPERRLQGV
jgi:hypothetical protein